VRLGEPFDAAPGAAPDLVGADRRSLAELAEV
jgi:hypothetical protein